jgi:hypothetical protein
LIQLQKQILEQISSIPLNGVYVTLLHTLIQGPEKKWDHC